ncbi:MAG TPA: DUF1080 domain-containing protein, partial [Tepidisphaeraceae bacterium]|nr:DUF1080 domain-containing protein [Tepidisphaeraceae bacterium]
MKNSICKLAVTALVLLLIAADEKPKDLPMVEPGESIFNGKDLAGWDKDADYWSVSDGEIVGKATEKHPYSYLTTKKSVADFRLIVEVKLVPNSENSGIQFRSARIGKNEMKGMQADVGKGWWGH